MLPEGLKNFFIVAWTQTVFWFKLKAGFRDLGQTLSVTGKVMSVEYSPDDGDFCFNLDLDPEFKFALCIPQNSGAPQDFWGKVTSQDGLGHLHCEVMPERRLGDWKLAALCANLAAGMRVKVTGRWAFDGAHYGLSTFNDVMSCLTRRAPNWSTGWTEIHPINDFVVLEEA